MTNNIHDDEVIRCCTSQFIIWVFTTAHPLTSDQLIVAATTWPNLLTILYCSGQSGLLTRGYTKANQVTASPFCFQACECVGFNSSLGVSGGNRHHLIEKGSCYHTTPSYWHKRAQGPRPNWACSPTKNWQACQWTTVFRLFILFVTANPPRMEISTTDRLQTRSLTGNQHFDK